MTAFSWEMFKKAIWPETPRFSELSWASRTFGQIARDQQAAIIIEKSKNETSAEACAKTSIFYFMFKKPWIRLFQSENTINHENEANGYACLSPVRWIEFILDMIDGFLKFLAIYFAANLGKPFFYLFAILQAPIAIIRNLFDIVFHPYDFFLKTYFTIDKLWENKPKIDSAQTHLSKTLLTSYAIMHTLKILITLGLIALTFGIIFGVPFAAFALPLVATLPKLAIAIAASLTTIELCKTGADLTLSSKAIFVDNDATLSTSGQSFSSTRTSPYQEEKILPAPEMVSGTSTPRIAQRLSNTTEKKASTSSPPSSPRSIASSDDEKEEMVRKTGEEAKQAVNTATKIVEGGDPQAMPSDENPASYTAFLHKHKTTTYGDPLEGEETAPII